MDLFSNLSKYAGILKLLAKFDPEDLPRVLAAVEVASDGDADLKDRVLAFIAIAEVVAKYVPGTADDEVVAAMKRIAESDDVWKLVEIVKELLANGGRVKDLDKLQFGDAQGFTIERDGKVEYVPWPVIIKIAGILLSLLAEFTDKK